MMIVDNWQCIYEAQPNDVYSNMGDEKFLFTHYIFAYIQTHALQNVHVAV